MKKSIIIPCIILAVCFLFLGLYIKECISWNSGIIIENFDKDTENKILSVFDLDKYDYVELSDVYFHDSSKDPFGIVSFKISREYVGNFEKTYLSEAKISHTNSSILLPERNYTFGECKEFYIPRDIIDYVYIYVKQHSDNNCLEYHIKITEWKYQSELRSVLRAYNTPFSPKKYRKIGHLKYDSK